MKLVASSSSLVASRRSSASSSSRSGDERRISVHDDSRGKIGIEFFPSFRRERRTVRTGGSERTSLWSRVK
jgi:hypothetical protein